MTPNLAVVHMNFLHGPNLKIWLPLFLLWVPAIVLAPFILLALLIGCLISGMRFWQTLGAFWAVLSSLPGTDVRVSTEGKRVLVRIL